MRISVEWDGKIRKEKKGTRTFFSCQEAGCCRDGDLPRRPRCAPGGFVSQALNRGVGRQTLFQTDGGYGAFEHVLGGALTEHPRRLLGYCVMPKHWHFVLGP